MKRKFGCLAVVLLAVVSCTREDFSGTGSDGGGDAALEKIVNEPSGGASDVTSLLIYVEDASSKLSSFAF